MFDKNVTVVDSAARESLVMSRKLLNLWTGCHTRYDKLRQNRSLTILKEQAGKRWWHLFKAKKYRGLK